MSAKCVFTFGVALLLVALLVVAAEGAPPSSWPPQLKSFDIWGDNAVADDESAAAAAAIDDIEPVPEDAYNAAISSLSAVEVIQSAYHGKVGQQRPARTSSGRNGTGRVLNFFPLPVDDECLADDGARSGICLNTYECRIQGGTSKGQCALGFGVCCVFTATCDQEVFNNITYITSPNFPSLMTRDIKSCKLKIKMISADVSQLRLDFVHFSLGQPNRSTGICDGDHFLLRGGAGGDFSLCGQNHGQHIYYDVPATKSGNETSASARQSDGGGAEDAANGLVDMIINFSDRFAPSRLFEIRVTQIPFSQRAPAGCMQYFTGAEGIIQTFNFAENGRHLANQNYRACIRQDSNMCSIQYEPCFDRAFRIGPRRRLTGLPGQLGGAQGPLGAIGGGGGGGGVGGGGGLADPATIQGDPAAADSDLAPLQTVADDPAAAAADAPDGGGGAGAGAEDPAAAAADDQTAAASADDPNAVEGSGDGGGGALPAVAPASSFFSLPSFGSFFNRRFFGFGGGARGGRQLRLQSRQQAAGNSFFGSECTDRITLPCIVEDFIEAGMGNVPSCLPIHCGDSLCAAGVLPCRVESTVTPFGIGVHFGDVGAEEEKGSPEDNIGACLRYNQLSCA